MNQQKIGEFLRELRKEKNLTQDQLAEQMNVSRRTVSRWETGSNMPDLSILVELADFYDADIREIIDGERKGDKVDREEKEKLLKAADYADYEKEIILKRIIGLDLTALFLFIIDGLLVGNELSEVIPWFDFLEAGIFGFIMVVLILSAYFAGSCLMKIRNKKKSDA